MNRIRIVRPTLCAALFLFVGALSLFGQNGSVGYSLFQAGDYDRAIRAARAELLNRPNDIDARIVLSWSMLATGRYQDALEIALATQSLVPNDARFVGVIGEAYYQTGNHLDALPFLERYTLLLPNGIAIGRINSLMGEVFIQFGEYHHATAAFAAATHFDPSVTRWWQRLGFAYEQIAEDTLAREAYQRAFELNPTAEIQRAIERVSR